MGTGKHAVIVPERVQFAAIGAAAASALYQQHSAGGSLGVTSMGFYVRMYGGSGSGTLPSYIYNWGGFACQNNAVTGTWQRMTEENRTLFASGVFQIGPDSATCAGGALPALDVCLWQADQQQSATIGLPIKTP